MTNLTPEVEGLMASLRARLNKNPDVDEGPLWNVVAAHLNATLASVEGGFRGETALREAMQVLAQYDTCRRRKKAPKRPSSPSTRSSSVPASKDALSSLKKSPRGGSRGA
jgi:hypothetical protein